MEKSIMFLLGAGVSIPANFPGTGDITTQVLSGSNMFRDTDNRYYYTDSPSVVQKELTNQSLSPVLTLLRSIKALMKSYDKKEPVNYEILYYFIQQLKDFESGELLNMALYPFLDQVKQNMGFASNKGDGHFDVFCDAEVYVRHTVWRMLCKNIDNHRHLSFLSDAFKDDALAVNVATLNHDLLIERHLSDNRIHFHDGFGLSTNGVRYWETKFGAKDNLLKIHGSINWFNLHPDNGDWFDDKIGIVLDGDIDHAKSPNGGLMRSTPEKEPKILIGTFNKIYEYTESIFSDIFYKFRYLLSRSKILVVSGYSFGDKGVNNGILAWLYKDRQNKIVVVHPDPETLLNHTARHAIGKAYDIAKNNFVTIPKYVQHTSWKEIKRKLSTIV